MTLCNLKDGLSWVLLCFFSYGLPNVAGDVQTVPVPPPPPGSNINPSMVIVVVILVCAFFCMGLFSVCIRTCALPRGMLGGHFDGSFRFGQLSLRAARGLDLEVIESFPTFRYSAVKSLKIGKGALECAVCLNEFEDVEMLRLIPECSHVFHIDCIDVWLNSHSTCPVCRADLVPKPRIEFVSETEIIDSDTEAGNQPESTETRINVVESSDVNLTITKTGVVTENRPPRSRSAGCRLPRLFPRSHSTGHSLIQRSENCERFTLRLPAEARKELIMSSKLNRTTSCVALPRAGSSRRGYRSRSGGRYGRIERPDGWGSALTPPTFTRAGSVRIFEIDE
ncbi:hypothetical protein SLEP1_g20913 [Rubroshorea leprosula]|uniref:RING-type E3 ubiquitin transferase n=1 Tax=Rubroshorea leprosula TaxID=152421 RepID=A0AAV5JEW4_9ROSI|nr:hypothetical protein SLEP1_g20913 [Rubroshorea leprosula]